MQGYPMSRDFISNNNNNSELAVAAEIEFPPMYQLEDDNESAMNSLL